MLFMILFMIVQKQLREALIDLHQPDMANDEDREALKKWSLNEVCEMFDWDYEIITNKVMSAII